MDLPLICQTDRSATTTPIVRLTYFEFFDTFLIMTVIIFYFNKLRMDYSIPSLFFKAARLSAAFAWLTPPSNALSISSSIDLLSLAISP